MMNNEERAAQIRESETRERMSVGPVPRAADSMAAALSTWAPPIPRVQAGVRRNAGPPAGPPLAVFPGVIAAIRAPPPSRLIQPVCLPRAGVRRNAGPPAGPPLAVFPGVLAAIRGPPRAGFSLSASRAILLLPRLRQALL